MRHGAVRLSDYSIIGDLELGYSSVRCEPRVAVSAARGTSAVGNRYQGTCEETADPKDLVHAVVKCKMRELALPTYWIVIKSFKCLGIAVTNPNTAFTATH
jgi:hypothetical protein